MVHDPPNLIPGIGVTLMPERPYTLAKQSERAKTILPWNKHILKMVSAKEMTLSQIIMIGNPSNEFGLFRKWPQSPFYSLYVE